MSRDEARGVWLLALGQTTGYAAVLFAFAGLLVTLERETGWARADMALGPTLGLLVAALVAPFAGRWVDRGWGGAMLGGSAAFGALCLIGLSQVTTLTGWYVWWVLNGLSQATGLFETCFAFLTRRLGPEARGAIVRVTLVSGFASSLAFPLGTWAGQAFGWRGGFLAFAVMQLAVTVPANLVGATLLRRGARRGPTDGPARGGAVGLAARRPEFWLIAVLLGALWMNHALLTTFALPVLMAQGLSEAMAATVASFVGPMQVAGRFFFMTGGQGLRPLPGLRLVAAGFGLAGAALLLATGHLWLLFVYAGLQGLSAGLVSILRPLVIAEVLGQENFGAVSGAIAMAPLSAMAVAPMVGAAMMTAAGEGGLVGLALGLAATALASALLLRGRAG